MVSLPLPTVIVSELLELAFTTSPLPLPRVIMLKLPLTFTTSSPPLPRVKLSPKPRAVTTSLMPLPTMIVSVSLGGDVHHVTVAVTKDYRVGAA